MFSEVRDQRSEAATRVLLVLVRERKKEQREWVEDKERGDEYLDLFLYSSFHLSPVA